MNRVSEDQIREMFKSIGSGRLMKESISDVTVWLSKNEGKNLQEAVGIPWPESSLRR